MEDKSILAIIERMHTTLRVAAERDWPMQAMFVHVKQTASATLGQNYTR